jgi:hypothetical protein
LNQHQELATDQNKSMSITGNKGDAIGVEFTGSGNIIGKQIVVGSGTINVSRQELSNINSEYANALKKFSETLNRQLEGKQIPEEQVKEINDSIREIDEEIQDLKPGQQLGEIKKSDIKSKLFRVAKNVLKVLPHAAETVALFTPLAPFSKVIGEGSCYLLEAIQKEL